MCYCGEHSSDAQCDYWDKLLTTDPIIEDLINAIKYCIHVGYADGARRYTRILSRYVLRAHGQE